MITTVHRPKIAEKLFFLMSGIVISTPFPVLANSLINYFLLFDLPAPTAAVLSIVIIAPLIEEFAKIYPLFYRHGESRQSLFSLGFLTGLGFGLAEFFIYIFFLHANILFRLPLILFHATNTSISAFGVGKRRSLLFYLLAVLLHAAYNFSVGMSGVWINFAFAAVAISYLLSLVLRIILWRIPEEIPASS